MYNAADEETVNARKEDVARERRQELEDIRLLLKRPEGVRFFRRLLRQGHMFHTTYTGNSQGMFLEGHRNFALMFFNDIVETAPDRVPDLLITEKEKEKEHVS